MIKRFFPAISLVVSCAALSVAIVAYYRSEERTNDFTPKLQSHIKACLEYNDQITRKDEILALLEEVEKNGYVVETGSDDLRVKFVNLQGCIEHVFACRQALGEITTLIGAIHTPTVATPLCVKPDEPISDGILDASIHNDLDKLLTVRSRAQIIREYLMKGGQLYVVYPKSGLAKRSEEQLKIYREELETFPNNLFDSPLSCLEIDPNMVGATYMFRNMERQVFAFSIKSRQANDIQKQSEWGIWFGELKDPAIAKRVNTIFDYLVTCDGPDLRQKI